jgi:hypothetical protein
MTNVNTKIKSLIEINKELRALVRNKLAVEDVARSNKALLSAFIFGKTYRTHNAVITLCEQGYGEDAFTLARTLFELMVNFAYITQSDSDENLFRYVNHEIVPRKKMMNYIKSKPDLAKQFQERLALKTDADFVKFIQNVDQEYDRLITLYDKSYKKDWSGKNIAQMASEIGREDAYATVYRLQCSHSHADISGISSNSSVDSGGLTLDMEVSERWVAETLVVAFDFFFHILTEVNTQLGWGLEDALKNIEERYTIVVRNTS